MKTRYLVEKSPKLLFRVKCFLRGESLTPDVAARLWQGEISGE